MFLHRPKMLKSFCLKEEHRLYFNFQHCSFKKNMAMNLDHDQ